MSRALAVCTACLLALCARTAAADKIDRSVTQLHDSSYKVRLAAALALSKSKDARAVFALADALDGDDNPTIRRVSALALGKVVDASTAPDARELAFDALDKAAGSDGDTTVRDTATKTLKALAALRRVRPAAVKSDKPEVFINIDSTTDPTNLAPTGAGDRVTKIVKQSIDKTGYATSWPGGLPTSAELSTNKSRAFIIASTVKKIEITKTSGKTQIACTVAIRVAPWTGVDGGEKWESNKSASASGSAKAMTGNTDREIASGTRDCLEAVAEDVTSRQVVPFLKRLAQAGI
ncbi:MAG: hypothetical protein JWO36_7499 [Myxococcales bacterium]|nr:hypothetical protein [Myxococcales bacterium]